MGGRTARRPSRSPSRSLLQSSSQPLLCHPPRWLPVCFGLAAGTDASGGGAEATTCGGSWRRGSRCGPHWRQDRTRASIRFRRIRAGGVRSGAGGRSPAGNQPEQQLKREDQAARPAETLHALKGSFEVGAVQPGLPDNRHQRAGAKLPVVGHRDGGGPVLVHPLHHDVAAAPSHLREAAGFEDAADLASRKNPLPSQRPPRRG